MIEIDDEPACYVHGLISSDSDNDSDDMREFDEEYNLMKPPPYDYELIKNRIIIISSQNTPNGVHVQQDQSTEENNNNKIKRTEVASKVAVTKKTENPAQKLNMAQIRNKKTNIDRKKVDMSGPRKSTETICSNQMLKTKGKSEYSKNKTIKKRSAAKLRDSKTREEKYLGLNITTREQFEKEFPSLDEVQKSKFRSACKLYKTKPTSSSISNKKKKKQFKPLKIEIYYKYIPKGKYLPEVKNRRRNEGTMYKVKFRESKRQHNIIPPVTNEINSKRKKKKKLKQSVKELLTQTETRHNAKLSNISKGQQRKKNSNQTNAIQENVIVGIGNENSSTNLESRPSLNDHRIVAQYENIFDGEFKTFVQNIIYEGTSITDLNCFTYKQLHLAYTAYLRKSAKKNSSNKAENIVINASSQKKKPIKKNKEVKQPTTKPRFDTMLDSERYLFIDGKRKMKRKLTQSIKVLLNKNILDQFGYVRHITQLAGGKTHTKICLPIDIYKYNYY